MSTRDVLREKMGVCREYVKIFSEMCDIAGYRVKCIRGFAKGPNYIPGKCIFFWFFSITLKCMCCYECSIRAQSFTYFFNGRSLSRHEQNSFI